ncbi:MAG: regulator of replication initiation timing [Patescibacteria group bacterium]|jgi:hypothetical protein
MEKTTAQLEKNVSASFSYVKKDILMLNDSYAHIQDAIGQILASHDQLATELRDLKTQMVKKPVAAKKVVAKKRAPAKKKISASKKKTTAKKAAKAKPVKKVVETITYS